jgi:hypothetical protein
MEPPLLVDRMVLMKKDWHRSLPDGGFRRPFRTCSAEAPRVRVHGARDNTTRMEYNLHDDTPLEAGTKVFWDGQSLFRDEITTGRAECFPLVKCIAGRPGRDNDDSRHLHRSECDARSSIFHRVNSDQGIQNIE